MQSRIEEISQQGLGLAAISYDSTEILAEFTDRYGISFPLLSDSGSKTIREYGILNTVAYDALGPNREDPGVLADTRTFVTVTTARERFQGVPFPGTFMLDSKGTVTARFFEDFYRERSTFANIMLRLGADGPEVEGRQISTPHLGLKTYSSDAEVAVGARFSLAMEITPRPGMHVYAPGAAKYRVITPRMETQPFVRFLPVQYPESETYFFEPLKEQVPVYQSAFILLQEVVPEVTREAQDFYRDKETLTLAGALEYQACDDQVCYNPESIPLTWTVKLRPFARRQEN